MMRRDKRDVGEERDKLASSRKKEKEEEKEEGDEDDDDDCADLDGHGRGVSVTAGGKKRVLTRFRHDRALLVAQPISRHFWINHRSDKGPRYIVAPWKSPRTFSQRTGQQRLRNSFLIVIEYDLATRHSWKIRIVIDRW
ncbi:hypothetical protein ALC60_10733 [Trachymyrmex zeteki]|uniref:Uncharacterized protein n=1 Tax=Mycetomoellerius zeteki TaxID=64791 RepID=A0A151WQN0_9HYME|nr:hypothetical protein ALC60_10733 [Trachymyrmex zeteki]